MPTVDTVTVDTVTVDTADTATVDTVTIDTADFRAYTADDRGQYFRGSPPLPFSIEFAAELSTESSITPHRLLLIKGPPHDSNTAPAHHLS